MDEILATVISISATSLNPVDEPIFTFYEAPRNQPQFLNTFFYPGRINGHQFAYEEDEAIEIARLSGEAVPVVEGGEITQQVSAEGQRETFESRAIEPRPSQGTVTIEERAARTQTTEVQTAERVEQERATSMEPRRVEREELPSTASNTPLMALLGIVALAGGLALRRTANLSG